MKRSLLGHLYTHIKGSTEDVATMSLQYLLNTYDELNQSFNTLLSSRFQTEIDKTTSYVCQSTGADKERPDMSGKNINGQEVILFEIKFYAGLTSNQPLTYLKRIKNNGGFGLVVICPKERMISLWHTLLLKCNSEKVEELGNNLAKVNDTKMILLSWEEIISILLHTANTSEKDSIGDIEQLKSYCEMIASKSFTPFKSEDLGSDLASKYNRLMYVLDRVVDSLIADKRIEANLNGTRITPARDGYRRFFSINQYAVNLQLNLNYWMDDRCVDTPYWISFRDSNWNTTPEIIKATEKFPITRRFIQDSNVFLAIDVLCNVYEEELVDNIKEQVIGYIAVIDKYNPQNI